MIPTKIAAKSSSGTTQKRKYKERMWRKSVLASLKKLEAAMEEFRTKVEQIPRRQRGKAKGARKNEISSKKHKRIIELKQFKRQIKKNKATLQQMEAQVAEQRDETKRMKGEMAGTRQATEDKKAELELLRLVNIQISNEVLNETIDISEAEENLVMDIIHS